MQSAAYHRAWPSRAINKDSKSKNIDMIGIEESKKEEGGIDKDIIGGFGEGTPAGDIAAA